MTDKTAAEQELATMMVDVLNLEGMTADDIEPEEILFGDGIGLDSIDALELSLAISKTYGVHIKSEDEGVKEAFTNLRTLSAYIQENIPQ